MLGFSVVGNCTRKLLVLRKCQGQRHLILTYFKHYHHFIFHVLKGDNFKELTKVTFPLFVNLLF